MKARSAQRSKTHNIIPRTVRLCNIAVGSGDVVNRVPGEQRLARRDVQLLYHARDDIVVEEVVYGEESRIIVRDLEIVKVD